MKNLQLYILIFSMLTFSCNNSETKQFYTIKDFIEAEKPFSFNVDSTYTFDEFLQLYDTLPSEFGYTIFNDIIESIPIDSSDFKKVWNWDIDTISNVLVKRTNNIFDSENLLSVDTYFFVVFFVSVDSLPIAATIYVDMKKGKIGTYHIATDTVKFMHIELADDSLIIDDIEERIKIYKR